MIAVIDFAGIITFGVDHYTVKVIQPENRDAILNALQDARNQRIGFDY